MNASALLAAANATNTTNATNATSLLLQLLANASASAAPQPSASASPVPNADPSSTLPSSAQAFFGASGVVFPWLYFVWACVLTLSAFGYYASAPRTLGMLAARAANLALRLAGAGGEVACESLSLSPLGGTAFFRGLTYASREAHVAVLEGHATLRWWAVDWRGGCRRGLRAEPGGGDGAGAGAGGGGELSEPLGFGGVRQSFANPLSLPCRLELSLKGLRVTLLNRSAALEEVEKLKRAAAAAAAAAGGAAPAGKRAPAAGAASAVDEYGNGEDEDEAAAAKSARKAAKRAAAAAAAAAAAEADSEMASLLPRPGAAAATTGGGRSGSATRRRAEK